MYTKKTKKIMGQFFVEKEYGRLMNEMENAKIKLEIEKGEEVIIIYSSVIEIYIDSKRINFSLFLDFIEKEKIENIVNIVKNILNKKNVKDLYQYLIKYEKSISVNKY